MDPIARTRHWLEQAVIGLNLCPFAKAVHGKDLIRWVLCPATTPAGLLETLVVELRHLAGSSPQAVDTTLIVHPGVLEDFLDYNSFLSVAEAALAGLGLEGELQIASFHPRYRFAGTRAGDMGNCSNRSPYPTLHLLREASIERAVAAYPQAEAIYDRNIRTLRALGRKGWQALDPGPAQPRPAPDTD
jgi:hypothetical protein